MSTSDSPGGRSASQLIDGRIAQLDDWRGETLGRMRRLIHQADPAIVEEWKWMGTPVWSHDGIVCTGESYQAVVKLTFAKGASLDDPARLFNASLDGNVRRAIDIRQGESVDADAFKALVRTAVAFNSAAAQARAKPKAKPKATPEAKPKGPASYFPSIEKTYGKPMDHWFDLVASKKDMKHMERVNWLKAEHGIGHGHANAIVGHCAALAKARP